MREIPGPVNVTDPIKERDPCPVCGCPTYDTEVWDEENQVEHYPVAHCLDDDCNWSESVESHEIRFGRVS